MAGYAPGLCEGARGYIHIREDEQKRIVVAFVLPGGECLFPRTTEKKNHCKYEDCMLTNKSNLLFREFPGDKSLIFHPSFRY